MRLRVALIAFVAALMVVLPASSAAETELGGIDFGPWCQRGGHERAVLDGPATGPSAAYNWRCQSYDGTRHPIAFNTACQWRYSNDDAFARPTNPDDAYSWRCFLPDVGYSTESEPNENISQAVGPLKGGRTYSRELAPDSDQDWFFFYTLSGWDFVVGAFNPYENTSEGCYPILELRDADGALIGRVSPSQGEVEDIRHSSSKPAKFYISVRLDGSGPCQYRFMLTPAEAISASPPPSDDSAACSQARKALAVAQRRVRKAKGLVKAADTAVEREQAKQKLRRAKASRDRKRERVREVC